MRAGLRDRHRDAHGGGVPARLCPGMVGNGEDQRKRPLAGQVPLDDAALEQLRDRIGGDEAEASQGRARPRQQLGRPVPPVHHIVGALVHLRMGGPKRQHIGVAEARAEILATDEGRVADDELGLRPVRPARIRTGLAAPDDRFLRPVVPIQHRVAAMDMVEPFQDRLARREAARPEVPLQMADPQDEIGDGDGARVQLHAEELVRPDQQLADPAELLAPAQLGRGFQHLAFQLLHQLLRDMQEIPGAAGRIEHAHRAEPAMEIVDQRESGFLAAALMGLLRRDQHVAPVLPQRRDHRLDHQPLDIGARGVMRAEPGALLRVERLLQQRAEDRRLDLAPVMAGRDQQFTDLLATEREDARLREELAVEMLELRSGGGGIAALVHRLPQLRHQRLEGSRIVAAGEQQRLEGGIFEQLGALGEHGEEAAHQEQRHLLRRVPRFQGLGDRRQPLGDLSRHARGMAGGIERQRVPPDHGDTRADLGPVQLVQIDAEILAIGKLDVVLALPGEVRPELEAVADIAEDQKGRPAMGSRQRPRIVLRLPAGVHHQHVPGPVGTATAARAATTGRQAGQLLLQQHLLGLPLGPALLRFEHEGRFLVEVDAADRARTVIRRETHRILEAIGHGLRIAGRRLRTLDPEQLAELVEELRIGGALGTFRRAPAGDERLDFRRFGLVGPILHAGTPSGCVDKELQS